MVLQKHGLWARLRDFADYHTRLAVSLLIGMMLIGGGAVGGAYVFARPGQTVTIHALPEQEQEAGPEAPSYFSPLTGEKVADEAATKRQVTAIMIENSMFARPQSGIKQAGVVFEAIAEGGITRLLTLHQEDRPGMIGPVRSVRPYYIDWLAAFDAAVAHVGGSANALKEVRNGSYKDIDQFFNGSYYYRAADREAPHNVYTNMDKLDSLNQKKGYTSSTFTGFPRKADSPASKPTASSINITVSSAAFNVAYTYDAATNSYLRSLGGEAHNDRELGRVTPKVVIAMKVPTEKGFEDGYREQMETIGHNTVYIFQDGIVTQGYWHKTAKRDQIVFYDQAGRPILLNAGQTWITVIAPDKAVTWQ